VTSNAYHFITTWRIPATPEEITAILGDAPALARWWPSVYLRVEELQRGDANGLGKVVRLWTKGWLPYTLRWQFTVTESDPPTGFRLDAERGQLLEDAMKAVVLRCCGAPRRAIAAPDNGDPVVFRADHVASLG
jgi:hypothetical protein